MGDSIRNEIKNTDAIIAQLKQVVFSDDKLYPSLIIMERIQELFQRNDTIMKELSQTQPQLKNISQDLLFNEMNTHLKQIQIYYADLQKQE